MDDEYIRKQAEQALEEAQSATQQAESAMQKIQENLAEPTELPQSELDEAEQKLSEAKTQLKEAVKDKKKGPTFAGYSVGDVAKALVTPPDPTIEKADPKVLASLDEVRQAHKHIKKAKQKVSD